jgi:hypothetical protein
MHPVADFPGGGALALGPEVGVEAASREELVVAAALREAPVVEGDDLVGRADCGEPVGHDQQGLARDELGERGLDEAFVGGVDGRGGLVERTMGGVQKTGRTATIGPIRGRVPTTPSDGRPSRRPRAVMSSRASAGWPPSLVRSRCW